MIINTVLPLLLIFMCIVGAITFILIRRGAKQEVVYIESMTMERLVDKVKYELAEMSRENIDVATDDKEWEAMTRRQLRINRALRECIFGKIKDKIIVKDLIASILKTLFKDEDSLSQFIDFNSDMLDPSIKFEILLQVLRKTYKEDTISYLIQEYNLDRSRLGDDNKYHNYIDDSDIDMIYNHELSDIELNYNDGIEVLATLVYEKYKGFGPIDTLHEMNIDGYTCGTSGVIVRQNADIDQTESIWLYHRGIHIWLKFLSFESVGEMQRVTQLICRYNRPGQLTEARGYILNTMADQSRVLAFGPQLGESWAFIVRKFSLGDKNIYELLDPKDDEGVSKYKHADLVINMLRYLMIGQVTSIFTGRQGSGKTTAMTRVIEFVDPRITIRVIELVAEMYLRELYPDRNIFSAHETPHVSAEEIQDAMKKSNANLTIVSEISKAKLTARLINTAQTSSPFTLASHHANTTHDLVVSLTNDIIQDTYGAASIKDITKQVVDAIHIDIHHDFDDLTGERYVDRITEIVPVNDQPYPEYDESDPVNSMNRIRREYYVRETDRELFKTVPLMRFDKRTKTYKTLNLPSTKLTEHILKTLPETEKKPFLNWVIKEWSNNG